MHCETVVCQLSEFAYQTILGIPGLIIIIIIVTMQLCAFCLCLLQRIALSDNACDDEIYFFNKPISPVKVSECL